MRQGVDAGAKEGVQETAHEQDLAAESGEKVFLRAGCCYRLISQSNLQASSTFVVFGVVGFGTFIPKYFEYHFR